MKDRPQSPGEEIANSLSHGLGFVAALASAPILVLTTAQTGRTLNVIGAAIFAVTMVSMRLNPCFSRSAQNLRFCLRFLT